jgi:ribosomal protein S18 acetylase RimI-like enzyme
MAWCLLAPVPSRSHSSCWVILQCCVLGINLLAITHALSAARPVSNAHVDVRQVQSHADLIALADLRYQEWMMEESAETRPSLAAFRMATAEIQQERIAQHAVVFLAGCKSDDFNIIGNAVVGAAELSPIEIQGCWDNATTCTCRCFYVTDVVTARTHRRKGVAATLMMAMEQHVVDHLQQRSRESRKINLQEPIVLLLHVEPSNEGALHFYESLGCKVYSSPGGGSHFLNGLNLDRLAENAGVKGQLVLFKHINSLKPTRIPRQSQGKGFGK